MKTYPSNYPGGKFRLAFDKVVLKYENEIKNNKGNAAAFSRLAEAYITLWCYGFISHAQAILKAENAVKEAFEISDSFGEVYTINGLIKMSYWQWTEAENNFKKGTRLSPDKANCHHWYALFLAAMGRLDESLTMTKKAALLDSSGDYAIGLGSIYYFTHEFDQLAVLMEALIEKEPDFAPGYDWLGMAYVQQEKFDQSVTVYKKAAELSDGLAEIMGGLGHAYGMAGRYEEARQVLDIMNNQAQEFYVPPVQIAFVYAGLGETDNMFKMLERAYKEKSWELIFICTEPWFDAYHGDPRFKKILKGLNLPAEKL